MKKKMKKIVSLFVSLCLLCTMATMTMTQGYASANTISPAYHIIWGPSYTTYQITHDPMSLLYLSVNTYTTIGSTPFLVNGLSSSVEQSFKFDMLTSNIARILPASTPQLALSASMTSTIPTFQLNGDSNYFQLINFQDGVFRSFDIPQYALACDTYRQVRMQDIGTSGTAPSSAQWVLQLVS